MAKRRYWVGNLVRNIYRALWSGVYNPNEPKYFMSQQLLVNGWLMIANTDNSEFPAPQTLGEPEFTLEDNPLFETLTDNSVVYSGMEYTFNVGGWIKKIRVWVSQLSETINYRIVIANITDSDNVITTIINNPNLQENAWATVALGNSIVRTGDKLLIYIDALNSADNTIFSDTWFFNGNSNTNNPPSGGWNKRNQNNILRFNEQSLVSNYALQLANLIPDSTITISQNGLPENYLTYRTISLGETALGVTSYDVILIDSGGDIATNIECNCLFTSPIPQPTEYSQISSSVPNPSWATIQGYLAFGGVDQDGLENTYGVDIEFQKASLSEYWEIQSYSPELNISSESATVNGLGMFLVTGGTVSYKQIGFDMIVFLESVDTYTLPLISTIENDTLFINLKNVSGSSVTVIPTSGNTISGETTQTIGIDDNMKLIIKGTDYLFI